MRGRLEVRDGFVVLMAALWFVDTGGVLPVFLLAAAVHEMGHAAALYALGGRLHRLTLTACGAVMRCRLPEGPYARAAVCLAGPAASFLLAALGMRFAWYRTAGASVLLGLFNLLPMPPLDGGMALCHALDGRLPRLRGAAAFLSACLLFAAGVALFAAGGGVWLLLVSGLTVLQTAKKLAKKRLAV